MPSKELIISNLVNEVERAVESLSSVQSVSELLEIRDAELDDELKQFITNTPVLGDILRHPLLFSVPYRPEMNALLNEQLRVRKAKFGEALRARDYEHALFIVERPYRLQYFIRLYVDMKPKMFCELLAWIYTDSESPSVNQSVFVDLFSDAVKKHDRKYLMTAKDRRVFAKFPDELTVYRGCVRRELRGARSRMGISWTLDAEKARWFSTRFIRNRAHGVVAQATINKHDIFFYDNGRAEQEVVLDPSKLRDVKILK